MIRLFSILVLFTSCIANAQTDTSFKLIGSIKGDIIDFTVDNLDNIYILNSRNQIRKYDVKGDSVAIFNDVKKFGKATLIDVSNPLKVLLYYKDYGIAVFLDRVLNVVNTIDLRKQNVFQAKAIGQSYDNQVWVYDEFDSKLKKIGENGDLLLETPDFRQLLGQAPSPHKIFDENKYVYLYDSLKGVYVFDYYGALKNTIQIIKWQNFKIAGKFIFGSRADTLFRYDIRTFMYDEWKMPEEIYRSRAFNFTSTRLYALRDNTIEIYRIQ